MACLWPQDSQDSHGGYWENISQGLCMQSLCHCLWSPLGDWNWNLRSNLFAITNLLSKEQFYIGFLCPWRVSHLPKFPAFKTLHYIMPVIFHSNFPPAAYIIHVNASCTSNLQVIPSSLQLCWKVTGNSWQQAFCFPFCQVTWFSYSVASVTWFDCSKLSCLPFPYGLFLWTLKGKLEWKFT